MSLIRSIIKIGLIVVALLDGHAAEAGPVRCSVNNQDSSCVGQITTAWQAPPTCPTAPGYTTVAAAQWRGSQYSAPQCNYQPPPTCPNGITQTSPATWNGASWFGLGCAAPPPAPPPPTDPVSQCLASATPQGFTATSGVTGPSPMTQIVSIYAQLLRLTNYGSDSVYSWSASGPIYTSACGQQGSSYGILCLVHPNGQINGLIPNYVTGSGGACNH